MNPDAILITQPAIDFGTLTTVSQKALGYSVATATDANHRKQHPAEKFLSMLAAIKTRDAGVGFAPHLLNHVSFSVLIAADDLTTMEAIECASGMPFVYTDTVNPGVQLSIVTGTLSQWRDAVVNGTRRTGMVRYLFNRIMGQFEAQNLKVWADWNKRYTSDGPNAVFYLEDKRK